VICLRIFVGHPARIKWLFAAAGALYVFGAVGMGLFYARFEFLYGRENITGMLILITTLEEVFRDDGRRGRSLRSEFLRELGPETARRRGEFRLRPFRAGG
jgi:hypothetical protein